MEAKEDEATKTYNNPSSFVIILLPLVVVAVAVVAFLGYWSLPTIVHSVQAFTAWFDWLCLVIRNVFFVLVFLNALVFLIYFLSHKNTTEKNKPEDIYDQNFAVVPSYAVRSSPENHFRETEVEKCDNGYYNNSSYKEMEPAFEAVKECNCYDRVVMEQEDSKSYKRAMSEKKAKTVEYRRMKSERTAKTSAGRTQTMDVLSSEQFRMTVETFITEKKIMFSHQNGVVDQRQTGFVDQWQTGFPNGLVNQWQTGGVPKWQTAVGNQWQNGAPQWQNDVVQWQELPDDETAHRSRNHRLEGGSGSGYNGSGSYLAISN